MGYGFLGLFQTQKPVFAMLHLKGETPEEKLERAKRETEIYYENGVDAVIVEDYFGTKADVEAVLRHMQNAHAGKIYGVNVLDNFHRSFELAAMYGARFVQVDSATGQLPPDLDVPYGKMIAAYRAAKPVYVLGGVRFKYQAYLSGRSLEEDLAIAKTRVDAVVVTGEGTGMDTDDEKIAAFRRVLGDFPLIVGAGVTPETCAVKLPPVDGAIVGSCFKDTGKDTGDVSAENVRAFMQAVQAVRDGV